MFPFVDILFKLDFSISHRSVDKCMVPASALSDTRSLLRFHIPNPRSHLGNKTPTPFPLFFNQCPDSILVLKDICRNNILAVATDLYVISRL